ncbi:Hypothetical protein SRAE_0000068600 [Strongyloides ratti]|uniref:Uncharacterized protein n=1 Tax=Strongyloides ratti TaxID=34506 RepID=A0A090MTB9_STRRB|nr:Hypothetical protein SRAE_0000068600 [Strongyloides ratti]CEF61568.1 Hypothetical protein SRAE_0000068600 [Strongyloides ratti]
MEKLIEILNIIKSKDMTVEKKDISTFTKSNVNGIKQMDEALELFKATKQYVYTIEKRAEYLSYEAARRLNVNFTQSEWDEIVNQ